MVNLDVAGTRGPGFVRIDLTNYGETIDALFGQNDPSAGPDQATRPAFDALVHLAAIPAPGILSDLATFHNNILSTFNVFQAARRAGIRNIVYASSETVLGLPFDVAPPYIPVDEEYPARPESMYSLAATARRPYSRPSDWTPQASTASSSPPPTPSCHDPMQI